MERIHKSTKLLPGDIVKVIGGPTGLVSKGCYEVIRVNSIIRTKFSIQIDAKYLCGNSARSKYMSVLMGSGFTGDMMYRCLFRAGGNDKFYKLTKEEAIIELI